MGYQFAAGVDKDRFPALIARDGSLSADSLRTAFALFDRLAVRPDRAVDVAEIAGAAGLPAERTRAALAILCKAGYLQTDLAAETPPAPIRTKTAPPSRSGGRTRGGGRLEAGIMDYELDIDGLIRAGDANIRGTGKRTADWSPLLSEESQPTAMRFMVWLRFVLAPEELTACDLFALDHQDRWKDWISRFSVAKAAGAEDQLLEEIRRSLNEETGGEAVPVEQDAPPGRSRPH